MEITPGNLRHFRVEFVEAMVALEEKYGLKIELGNITYDNNEFRGRLTCSDTSNLEKGQSPRDKKLEEDYKNHCQVFGLKPEWLGQTFISNGEKMTIVGLKTRASKRPVVVNNENGGGYVFPADSVKLRMNAVKANSKTNG